MKVTLELTIHEIQAIHASFMAITDGKLDIQIWNKVYDIIEEMERHLTSVANKERELRDRLLKEYPDEAQSNELQNQFQVGMELIMNKKVDVVIDETAVISVDTFQSIKDVEISGRDFINIRVFCNLLTKNLESTSDEPDADE